MSVYSTLQGKLVAQVGTSVKSLMINVSNIVFNSFANRMLHFLDPGREKVVAPIVRFKSSKELTESAAILVSVDEFESVLSRHVIVSFFVMPDISQLLHNDMFLAIWFMEISFLGKVLGYVIHVK